MLRFLTGFALALPMMAGSFVVSVGDPAAAKDPAARGAIATARLTDHTGPADNSLLEITAEGLVNGRRVTQPVRVTRLANSMLAIHWKRPAGGTWALRFQITSAKRAAFAEVGQGGVRPQTHPLEWSETDRTAAVLGDLAKGDD